MSQIAQPADATQLASIVEAAARTRTPIVTAAGDSKWDWGRGRADDIHSDSSHGDSIPTQLSLAALSGIVDYQPSELVLVVGAATPLSQIEPLLSEQGQHLAFEPVHWRSTATAGGTVAVGLAGPRRFRAGSVRDFVLGLQFVDGKGRLVRSGGRVVKNVSGFDLWRGLTGSFGGLGLITEICFKLWPRPEAQCTLRFKRTQLQAASLTMLQLAQRQEEISALAYVPTQGVLARLEGSESALQGQIESIARDVAIDDRLSLEESHTLWRALREVESLREKSGTLWRFVVPAAGWVQLVGDLTARGIEDYHVDWGGGQVWALAGEGLPLKGHEIADRVGGIAWRLATNRQDTNAEGGPPLDPGLRRLNMRLKNACDPQGILNPGRGAF